MIKLDNIIQGPEPSLRARVTGFLLKIGNLKLCRKLESEWPEDIEDQVALSTDILHKTGMVYD